MGIETNSKNIYKQLHHTFVESYSNRGKISMYESNYQQLYHTLVDICSNQEQL